MRIIAFIVLVASVFVVALASLAVFPAHGQPSPPADATMARQCPGDRPHRLEIETGTMTCSAVQCMGRMDCGTGTCKITRDLGDSCNTCTMRTYVACLSETDLKAMRR